MKRLLIILTYVRRIEGVKCYGRVLGFGFLVCLLSKNRIYFTLFYFISSHHILWVSVLVRDDCTAE